MKHTEPVEDCWVCGLIAIIVIGLIIWAFIT